MTKRVQTYHSPLPDRRRDITPRRHGAQRSYDFTQRDPEARAFYSSGRWQALRRLKRKLTPLCERCQAQGIIRTANLVHHRVYLCVAWDDAMILENLESLCHACHNAEHKRRASSLGQGDEQDQQANPSQSIHPADERGWYDQYHRRDHQQHAEGIEAGFHGYSRGETRGRHLPA